MNVRRVRWAAAVLAVAVGVVPGTSTVAQDVTDINGSADFRNPPSLVPGTYRDTLVTGEAVWYSMLYTDDTPYRFEVTFPGVDLDAQDEVSVTTSFVTPTLGAVDSAGTLLEGPGASIQGGGQQTFVWYLVVELNTTGRLGVEYEMILDVEGPETSRLEPCSELPDCTYDDELAELDAELSQIQADLAALADDGTESVFLEEIAALEAELTTVEAETTAAESSAAAADERAQQAERDLASATAMIADVCAPASDCVEPPDPGSSTPAWSLVLAGLVLAGGLVTLIFAVRRRHA